MSRPYRTPPPTEAARPWQSRTAKTAPTGIPGSASRAVPTAKAAAIEAVAVRGGRRSAADISRLAPITWLKEAPNMLSAESRGDPVAA